MATVCNSYAVVDCGLYANVCYTLILFEKYNFNMQNLAIFALGRGDVLRYKRTEYLLNIY